MSVLSFREDLDEDEYTTVKEDTIEQLKEFNESLTRMKGGDLSLVNDLNRIQLVFVYFTHVVVCEMFLFSSINCNLSYR